MSATPPPDLFGQAHAPSEKRLKDPVRREVLVMRESAKAVLLRQRGGPEHWIPKELLLWDGPGMQLVMIEKWKAAACQLI